MHSWAGFLTCRLYEKLHDDATVAILPAIGTHAPMTDGEIDAHVSRHSAASCSMSTIGASGVVSLGEVPATLIHKVSEGKLDFPVRVEVDRL